MTNDEIPNDERNPKFESRIETGDLRQLAGMLAFPANTENGRAVELASALEQAPMRNHIKEILFALSDTCVRYIVGGGVAAVLHGVERVTMDVDIAVDFEAENMDRFAGAMHTLGMQPRVPVPIQALQDPEIVRMMVKEKQALVFSLIDPRDPLRYLDVFLKPELSYHALVSHAEPVEVEGRTIQVVSASHLLTIKEAINPPRDKDQLDIQTLRKLLGHE